MAQAEIHLIKSDRPTASNSAPNQALEREVLQRQHDHALAFLRLENPVIDAAAFASIVEDLIIEAGERGEVNERAVWAVIYLANMVRAIRREWRSED